MRLPPRTRWDLSPVGHPIWWAALALLVGNDHVLKHAGLLPGWLTGKLSDFAFLIVAPVLLGALLPVGLRLRRALAVLAVGGLFAAAKLSPAVSDALVRALRHAGIAWRLWPDPTDLVALSVLPVAARLMRGRTVGVGLGRRLRERAGVLLGALACVATSAPPSYPHAPFLLNAAPDAASVRITWLLRAIPCAEVSPADPTATDLPADLAPTVAASLTPGDLDDPIEADPQRGQVAALDGAPPPGTSPVGQCMANMWWGAGNQCVGAILESPPAAPVLMVARAHWSVSGQDSGFFSCDSPPAPTSACSATLDPARDPGPDAVTLTSAGGALQFVAGAHVRLAPVDLDAIAARTAPPGNCRALRDRYQALLQPPACAADGDCVAVPNLAIPGAPSPCGVDTTLAGARVLADLGAAWSAGCAVGANTVCSTSQPAVCRSGACAPACPGEDLPFCPGPCSGADGLAGSPCTGADPTCARPDGLNCACVDGRTACDVPRPLSPTCPLACNDWSGGGTYVGGRVVHPSLDGGASDGGAPDGGAVIPDAGSRD
jgi:hypothetical protein